jgi:hypothetical protein
MTTITRRKPALYQSTNGAGAHIDSASSNLTSSNIDERDDRDDERDNDDDKETRLTLMEEVLLLGLKDREVRCVSCCYRFVM